MTWQPHYTIWATLMAGWVAIYMIRIAMAPLLGPLMAELQLSYVSGGFLSSAFFYAYAVAMLPAGVLGDRIGRRRVVALASIGVGLASVLTGLAQTFLVVFLARLLTGALQGAYFSNDRAIVALVTPRTALGIGQGLSFMGPGLGIFLGIVGAGALAEHVSWRQVFMLFAILPIATGVVIAWLVPEPPRAARRAARTPTRLVYRSRDLWLLAVASIAGIYNVWVIGTWAPLMFTEIGVAELGRSSLYASLQGLAALPGLALLGVVSDRTARRGLGRKSVMAGGQALMAASVAGTGLTIAAGGPPWLLATGIVLVSFFAMGAWAPCYALMSEMIPDDILGTAFGFINSVGFIGGLTAPVVTGWIRDQTGSFELGCYLAAAIGLAGAAAAFAVRPVFRLAAEPRLGLGRAAPGGSHAT